jgi:outer membrane protein assembly factor BamB
VIVPKRARFSTLKRKGSGKLAPALLLLIVMVRWLLLGMLLAQAVLAENWPQFRGPRGDGTSTETNVPVRWSATQNIKWKANIPGEGHSSPIVWERSVFVTSATDNGDRHLIRVDAGTGKIVWQKKLATGPKESMHRENSSASSTPATDGTRIVTSFQVGDRVDLRCFDFEGRQLWAVQPLRFDGQHGYSYSPIIYKDLVLFDCRQEGEAALLALDKRTGQVRWRATPGNKRISHITPLLVTRGNQTQLIVSGSDETRSYNPDTGQPIWWCNGPSDVAVAGLAYGEGMVFATAGYPDRTRMAIRVDGRGDVTKTHVAWSSRRQVTYVPSPVYHAGHLYSVIDEGMVCCFDAKTGQSKWEYRLGGRFRASLVLAAGRIYATNDKGLTTIFVPNPQQFQALASNDLGNFCYATPAISNGRIFLRAGENLYSIAEN